MTLDQDKISSQMARLEAHRKTLRTLLYQEAMLSELYAPPSVAAGIDEARKNIKQIKRRYHGSSMLLAVI